MKTKTIYHLDHDCNIVSIEVIAKGKKNKKRSITMNIERLIGGVKIVPSKRIDVNPLLELWNKRLHSLSSKR